MSKEKNNSIKNGTNDRLGQVVLIKLIIFLWYLVPVLSEKIIKKMFFVPRKNRPNDIELSPVKFSKPFVITVNNQKVQCWEWGTGPTVIFVHGWGGYGLQFSKFINPLMEQGFSVITYDNPGHGLSEGQTSSYFEFCDALRALIQHLPTEKIQGVVGHSLGAAAVINCLAKEEYKMAMVLIAPALKIKEALDDLFNYYQIPKKLFEKLISQYENKFGHSLKDEEPLLLLNQIKSKGLIIHDVDDRRLPYIESKETSERFSNLTLLTKKDLGHKRILMDQAIITKAIHYLK